MRLLLRLKAYQTKDFPYNYHYPLAAAIYRILKLGSPEFAGFLHNTGYRLEGKQYKLFTFALRFEKVRAGNSSLSLSSPDIGLYISSPLIDQFIQNFVLGTFENQQIELNSCFSKAVMNISSVEVLPEPGFTHEMKFTLLSPLVLSTKIESKGKLIPYYLRYNDDINEINRILNKNLRNKLQILLSGSTQHNIDASEVTLEWDRAYIEKADRIGKRLTAKTTIDAAGRKIDVIGNRLPFYLKGDPELIRTGYLCGFGEKNSMGFGMAELETQSL